jgi:gamma-glutamyltranspeptidase
LDQLNQKREVQAMQPESSVSIGAEIAGMLSTIEAAPQEAAPEERTSPAEAMAKAVREMQSVLADPEFMANPSAAYDFAIGQLNDRIRNMRLTGSQSDSSTTGRETCG